MQDANASRFRSMTLRVLPISASLAAGSALQAAPPYAVTPVLVVPSDMPRGRVESEKMLLAGEIALARDWYAGALGRNASWNLQPVAVVYSPHTESYFDDPDMGSWFYKIVGDVNAAGYSHGSDSSPQIIVGVVLGGAYHSGATQHLGNTGGGYANHNTGDYSASVIAHEIGHSFGLPHPDVDNPTTATRDNAYTVMYNFWDYPSYPANPADPSWSLRGLHAWQGNSGGSYQDQWLIANRTNWFATAQGTILNWDGDGSYPASGGSGTWNTSTANWSRNASGPNTTWTNSSSTRAVFWGSAGGNVNVPSAVTTQSLTFYRGGYRLYGSGSVVLSAGAGMGTIAVWDGMSAELAVPVGGASGLLKIGGGDLVLSSPGQYTGSTFVGRGTLKLGVDEVIPNASSLTINSRARLDLNGRTETVAALTLNEGQVSGAGNLVLAGDVTAAGNSNSISGGALTFNAARVITVDGALAVGSRLAGAELAKRGSGVLTLSNAANSCSSITLWDGTLSSATPGALGAGTVTLAGGSLLLGTRELVTGAPLVSGFGGTGVDWTKNGSAVISGDVATLASDYYQAGSVFHNAMVPLGEGGFQARFIYQNGGWAGGSADGITFVLQRDPRGTAALGEAGGSLGYASANAIQNSAGIALNLYPYASGGIGVATVDSGEVRRPYAPVQGISLDSGHPIEIVLTGTGSTLRAGFTDMTTGAQASMEWPDMRLSEWIGGPSAYVGFTGGTGGWNGAQRVSGFRYSLVTGWNGQYANAVTVSPGASSTIALPAGSSGTFALGPLSVGQSARLAIAPAQGSPTGVPFALRFGDASIQHDATLHVLDNGAGAGTLTLGAVTASGRLNKTGAGTLVVLGSASFGGDVSVNEGTLRLEAAAVAAGDVIVAPAAVLSLDSLLVMQTPGHVLDVRSLTMGDGGGIDLGRAGLILRSEASGRDSALAWLAHRIDDGSIFSSVSSPIMHMAFAINDRGGHVPVATRLGTGSPGADDVIALCTFHGDSDFSGGVDGDDYYRMDAAFLSGDARRFIGGDIDGDGLVDGRDYLMIDRAFFGQAALTGFASVRVPEPSSLLAITPFIVLARRRR